MMLRIVSMTRAGAKAFALLLSPILLTSCAAGAPGSPGNPVTYPDLTRNWQIQSDTAPATIPAGGVLVAGALQSSGASVSGTFRFSNLAQPRACGLNEVVAASGAVDSTGHLTLTSPALPDAWVIKTQLAVPAIATNFATGTIEISGGTCAFASSPATAVQIAPVTGTFAGTLAPGTLGSPGTGPSGTASLNLTQATLPAADGQFPLTGSLSYAFGGCTKTVTLTGTASGLGVELDASTTPLTGPYLRIIGTTVPTATQITVRSFVSAPGLCSADPLSTSTYNGTLPRQ